jgi:hypothetical protein
MSVLEAVEAGDRVGALRQTARSLAAELDGRASATSKSMCAKALVDVLRELESVAPAVKEADAVDDLDTRRKRRRAATQAAAPSV